MNRRELIQAGLLVAGANILSGCNKEVSLNDELEIIPKQTGIYEFSTPMPFNYSLIDEISQINQKYKKLKVTGFHQNIPIPLAKNFNQWTQVVRGENHTIRSYDDFKNFMQYAIGSGFQFTYLMNSPKPFSENDFNTFRDEFKYLLDFLYNSGCRDIKVGNTQVATLINQFAPNVFNLSTSTAFEYHNLAQYENLFRNYPNFNLIDLAIDENQNFAFQKGLRKAFPDKKIELIMNEHCIKGCPARISHCSEISFNRFDCLNVRRIMGDFYYFYRTGVIYPWNIEYYSAIGVNNFKLTADVNGVRSQYNDLSSLRLYFDCVEYGINDLTVDMFFNRLFPGGIAINKDIKISELLPYLPDVAHFIKNGDKCATRCGADCKYCELCAKRTENFLFG
ncbi:MAG: hypothetical protein IJ877_07090 [Candidatus Gastranaerophilales bacterium]|nr:hypothetical protein [Candidatus Gastranaerophilales bacterium]